VRFGRRSYDAPLRLCKDCKFFDLGECSNPENIRINLVTGAKEYRLSAHILREGTWVSAGDCGERGRWWQAAEDKEE